MKAGSSFRFFAVAHLVWTGNWLSWCDVYAALVPKAALLHCSFSRKALGRIQHSERPLIWCSNCSLMNTSDVSVADHPRGLNRNSRLLLVVYLGRPGLSSGLADACARERLRNHQSR